MRTLSVLVLSELQVRFVWSASQSNELSYLLLKTNYSYPNFTVKCLKKEPKPTRSSLNFPIPEYRVLNFLREKKQLQIAVLHRAHPL